MSKFCTKCGKKLEEGEVCNCEKNTNASKQSSITGDSLKESCMDCVNVFKNIFTKPTKAIKEFVSENKYIAGIIMIVLVAISKGLYHIATLKNNYNSVNTTDFSSLLSSALTGNLVSNKPEYLKEFFTTFGECFIEYALIVLIGYLIISKLLKGTSSLKQIINAVAISLSIVLVGNLLNSILVFMNGDFVVNIRGYIASFAYIMSILIFYKSISDIAEVDKNKLFISIPAVMVCATIVMDIFQKLFS